jgi:hypothetical protein
MSQSTFDDDDLFGEAAAEMRAAVESHLTDARGALPEPDAIWDVEADNVLGVLNSLRSSLDTGDAADHLRQAKKQFVMGKRAEAFEDADDLEEAIADLEELLADVEAAHEQVGELTGVVPQLRGSLQEAADAAEAAEEEDDDADTDADAEAEAAADGGEDVEADEEEDDEEEEEE